MNRYPSAAVRTAAIYVALTFAARVCATEHPNILLITADTRLENWKIVRERPDDAWQLFDLSADIGEKTPTAYS